MRVRVGTGNFFCAATARLQCCNNSISDATPSTPSGLGSGSHRAMSAEIRIETVTSGQASGGASRGLSRLDWTGKTAELYLCSTTPVRAIRKQRRKGTCSHNKTERKTSCRAREVKPGSVAIGCIRVGSRVEKASTKTDGPGFGAKYRRRTSGGEPQSPVVSVHRDRQGPLRQI